MKFPTKPQQYLDLDEKKKHRLKQNRKYYEALEIIMKKKTNHIEKSLQMNKNFLNGKIGNFKKLPQNLLFSSQYRKYMISKTLLILRPILPLKVSIKIERRIEKSATILNNNNEVVSTDIKKVVEKHDANSMKPLNKDFLTIANKKDTELQHSKFNFIYNNIPDANKTKILVISGLVGNNIESSTYIRLFCPLTINPRIKIKFTTENNMHHYWDDSDIFIIQRTAISRSNKAEELINHARKLKKIIITDNDDAFSQVTKHNPNHSRLLEKDSILRLIMHNADSAWFSTEPLALEYSQQENKSVIMPNMLDPRIWYTASPHYCRKQNSKSVNMVYMGSPTHDDDFKVLLPALEEVYAQKPGSFNLTIIGALREPPIKPWLKIKRIPNGIQSYPKFANWLLNSSHFDIGLAPLKDTKFNQCKSDIKFLDYCAMGIAPVLSDCTAYRQAANTKDCAVISGNTASEWKDCLIELIDNPDRTQTIAENAWNYVWSQRHVSLLSEKQINAINNIKQQNIVQ